MKKKKKQQVQVGSQGEGQAGRYPHYCMVCVPSLTLAAALLEGVSRQTVAANFIDRLK